MNPRFPTQQVFDPRILNDTIESVAIDGIGVISQQTQDECLDTETEVDKCYRVFVSGFTLADQVGGWSIGEYIWELKEVIY